MSVFRHLYPHFLRQRWLFAVGVLALLATNFLQQYIPQFLKHALDSLQKGEGSSDVILSAVLFWAGLRVAAVAMQGVLRYGWRMGFFGMGRKVEHAMRSQLFAKLLTLSPPFFRRMRVGDLLSRAMSDLATVRESLGFGWLAIVDSVSMMLFTGFFMLRVDWRLTLTVLAPLVLIPPLVMTLGRRVRENSRQAQALLDKLSQTATESFSGARVIHAYARQEAESARFDATCRDYRAKNLGLVRLEAVYWPLLTVLAGCSELLLFVLGGRMVAEGRLTLGDFAMLNDYLLQIVWPVMALGFSTNMYVRGKVSVERLNEVYDAVADIQGPPRGPDEGAPGSPRQARGRHSGRAFVAAPGAVLLRLQDVGFRYPGSEHQTLKGVNLSLQPGEWVGLAGRTGSGKTSLLRLLPRLDDATEGSVELWGRAVQDWPLEELRRRMALVAQEPFLFSETVLENAAFAHEGDAQERRDEAVAAARLADFHAVAQDLPQGYDSLLGEKGVNLSGGQKQRLALARALFARPELLLLDDAFSAVDTATEERIVAGLRQALPSTAVLLVSHRVSTLRLCSRVLVLEDGRISADGPPQRLLEQDGFFREMARREQLARSAGLEA
jgi:ATP-binding cassette, subfamily B, multidrug efflux pump